MITMLATFCHMATVSTGMPAIEFCQEQVVARRDDGDADSCYLVAQQIIAPRLMPGYTVKQIRCIKGNEPPRDAI